MEKITVNGVVYVRESDLVQGKDAPVIVRGDRSGVYYGTIEKRQGKTVILRNARNIWYWSGAASLSQLAEEGVKDPAGCKFPQSVAQTEILDVIQIFQTTEAARKSIEAVPIWKK